MTETLNSETTEHDFCFRESHDPAHLNQIDSCVSYLKTHRLEHVASFLIESHIPAFGLIDAIFLACAPFLQPFVGPHAVSTFRTILSNSELKEYALHSLLSQECAKPPQSREMDAASAYPGGIN